MREFKVGDRIRYIGVDEDYKDKCGTIIVIDNSVNLLPYGVKFDERIVIGHNLNEQCEDGYGLWLGADDMKLVLEDYTIQELEEELERRKEDEISNKFNIINKKLNELKEMGIRISVNEDNNEYVSFLSYDKCHNKAIIISECGDN